MTQTIHNFSKKTNNPEIAGIIKFTQTKKRIVDYMTECITKQLKFSFIKRKKIALNLKGVEETPTECFPYIKSKLFSFRERCSKLP